MKFLKILVCCSIMMSCQQEETINADSIIGSWVLNERVWNVPSMGIVDSVPEILGQPTLTIHADSMLVRIDPIFLIQPDTGEVYSSQDGYNVVFPDPGLKYTIYEIDANTIVINHSYHGPLICDPNYYKETYVRVFN